MRLTIFGSGYVGLVTGACFAEVGNNVLCVDVDQRKVDMLKRGESPIYEPGLDELLKKNLQPHFLMNTLAVLTEVVEQNPTVAARLIEDLAEEFRTVARVSAEKLVAENPWRVAPTEFDDWLRDCVARV